MKKLLPFLIILLVLLGMALAADFVPNGDINGRNYYKIYNFTNITSPKFCDSYGTCVQNFTELNSSGSGDISSVNTPDDYLYGGATTGDVTLYLNETTLNSSILSYVEGNWINGSNLYYLNATALAFGLVPSARVVGNYASITGVGTLLGLTMGANIDMSQNNITDVNAIIYDTTGCTEDSVEGTSCWNPDDQTLNIVTSLGNVIQVGMEMFGIGINEESFQVLDGQVVYASGAQGDRLKFKLADGSNLSESAHIGIVTSNNCTASTECPITVFGEVRNIDTSAWSAGTKLYLNSSAPGNLTDVIPALPNNPVWVATVIVSHASAGSIFVNPKYDPSDGIVFNKAYISDSVTIVNNLTVNQSINMNNLTLKNVTGNSDVVGDIFVLEMTGPGGSKIPHFWVSPGGSTQASGISRSFMIVNENASEQGNYSKLTSCSSMMSSINEELKVDCNTTTTGADLIVTDDSQFVGDVWIKNSRNQWRFMTRVNTLIDDLFSWMVLNEFDIVVTGDSVNATAQRGETIVVNLNGTENITSATSAVWTWSSGTNASPNKNYVYYGTEFNPTLQVSTTAPTENTIAELSQSVIGANGYSYASIINHESQVAAISKILHRLYDQGSLYISGFTPSVGSNNVNITSGNMRVITHIDSDNVNYSTLTNYFFVYQNNTYVNSVNISSINEYADGNTINNNKYFNIVFGIVHNDAGNNRLMAVVQDGTTEYITISGAETDTSNLVNVFPSDTMLKRMFIPVARVVVQRSGGVNTIQTLSNGQMYIDLRGTVGSGAGASASPTLTDHNELNNLEWSVAGHTIDSDIDLGGNDIYNAKDGNFSGALNASTLNTGQGDYELYAMNQDVESTDAVTFATVDTGQGANELYDMDQNVLTSSNPSFAGMNLTGNLNMSSQNITDLNTVTLANNGTILDNSTCVVLYSPDGTTTLEICN